MALDRLEAMRAFCRIVETGGFGKAAESLGLATTTVSGQVRALETLLGIRLLHRSTRKVAPTSEGAAYYARARALIDEVDELETSVSQSQRVVRGRVSVEMPTPLGLHLVIPALPDFTAKFPEVRLDIGCSERVVDLVEEGIDCAIRGGTLADLDLVSRTVGQMRFCVCAAPSYLAGAAPVEHPAGLARHRRLGFRFPGTGKQLVPILTRGHESVSLDQAPCQYFDSGAAVTAAAVAGLGVACLARAEAAQYLRSGALVEILEDWRVAGMPLSVVYPPTRRLSAKVRAFTDWVADLIASDPLWSQTGRI